MNSSPIRRSVSQLKKLRFDLLNRDFLLTWEKSDEEIRAVLLLAECLKELHRSGISLRVFDSGLAISIFRDHSTRTRFSFASAVNALGLTLAELDEVKSQIAHGETVRETAHMISFLTEVIGIRDDMYLGEGNRSMREVAAAVQDGFENRVLPIRPSVVNLQCDIDHPTQTLSDLLHIQNRLGGLEKAKGVKVAVSWAYSPSYGKPLSVPQGLIGLLTRFGMNVTLAHPPGYELMPDVIDTAKRNAARSGGSFSVAGSMEEAFRDAAIVYPKSWAPWSIMERRTALLKRKNAAGLRDLETECLENNAKHRDWECDGEKMKLTAAGQALYMHCLPADISGVTCPSGEVSGDVFETNRRTTYRQAGYKPFVIAAIVFLSRVPDPAAKLEWLIRRKLGRIL